MSDWFRVTNVDDVPSPALLVYPDRIQANLHRMVDLVGDVKRLRPHVKTHKMPAIVRMKRAIGIDKFKVATIAEAEMVATEGARDILLAYQPVGPNVARLLRLIDAFPETRFAALVDDPQALTQISRLADEQSKDVELYIDLNVGMNRTGIAPGESARSLYHQLATSPGVRPAGIHAYDGHLHNVSREALAELVDHVFQPVWELKSTLEKDGLTVPGVIVSGTPTSSVHAGRNEVEIGPGTTVLWDCGQPHTTPEMGFVNAAVLLSRVISRPAPGMICVDLGYKAIASEMPHPRMKWFELGEPEVVVHSEEHLVMRVPNSEAYPVGTSLYAIPRHICPTVALYDRVWCIREGRAGETWPVTARARVLTI